MSAAIEAIPAPAPDFAAVKRRRQSTRESGDANVGTHPPPRSWRQRVKSAGSADRRPERDLVARLHCARPRPRCDTEGGPDRIRGGAAPADPADRRGGNARGVADHPRPCVQRAGMVADLRAGRLNRVHFAPRPRRLLDAVSGGGRSRAWAVIDLVSLGGGRRIVRDARGRPCSRREGT
jgi:hypothetical protein